MHPVVRAFASSLSAQPDAAGSMVVAQLFVRYMVFRGQQQFEEMMSAASNQTPMLHGHDLANFQELARVLEGQRVSDGDAQEYLVAALKTARMLLILGYLAPAEQLSNWALTVQTDAPEMQCLARAEAYNCLWQIERKRGGDVKIMLRLMELGLAAFGPEPNDTGAAGEIDRQLAELMYATLSECDEDYQRRISEGAEATDRAFWERPRLAERYAEALTALEGRRSLLVDTVLGAVKFRDQDYLGAVPYLRSCLEGTKALMPWHPDTTTAAAQLGIAMLLSGEEVFAQEAETLFNYVRDAGDAAEPRAFAQASICLSWMKCKNNDVEAARELVTCPLVLEASRQHAMEVSMSLPSCVCAFYRYWPPLSLRPLLYMYQYQVQGICSMPDLQRRAVLG